MANNQEKCFSFFDDQKIHRFYDEKRAKWYFPVGVLLQY